VLPHLVVDLLVAQIGFRAQPRRLQEPQSLAYYKCELPGLGFLGGGPLGLGVGQAQSLLSD
jgi:hypothetical protein